MPRWAILPVKPFRHAKSRLSEVLGPAERVALVRTLLIRTLAVLAQTPGIAQRLVISRDAEALAVARQQGALTMSESGTGFLDLNVALRRATFVARASGASAVLIVPGDLPQVTPADMEALLELDAPGRRVILAPDRHEAGTNALLVGPPGLIAYAFGAGSFLAHVAQAEAAPARLSIVRRPGLAFDLDTPADWQLNQGYTSPHIPLDPTRRPS